MGLPDRHARRPRGGGVPGLRGARLGRRTAHLAAGGSARPRDGPGLAGAGPRPGGGDPGRGGLRCRPAGSTSSTASTAATCRSRWSTRTPSRCAGWRSSTWSSTTPTARAATCWRWRDGHRYGVDHGVTFHVEHKLRTVLWGWLGDPVPEDDLAEVLRRRQGAVRPAGRRCWPCTSPTRRSTPLATRCRRLSERAVMPAPRGSYPAIPWPPF